MIIEKSIHLDWCDTDLKATPNGVDVWENDWHYYFTWEAGMREAKAQGFRLPTKEEWEDLLHSNSDLERLNFSKAGYRGYSNGQYYGQGSYGYFWSSTPDGTSAYYTTFYSGGGYIATGNGRAFGFSVRCLKN